jgi:hypothetical protein
MVLVLFVGCSLDQIKGILAEDNSGVVTFISSASRFVYAEEHHLSVHQLELISISWAYQQFEDIIGQQPVILYTDYTDSVYLV